MHCAAPVTIRRPVSDFEKAIAKAECASAQTVAAPTAQPVLRSWLPMFASSSCTFAIT